MAGTSSGSPRARVLGAWLRDAREGAGLGVRELARTLNMQHPTLSRWETAERTPRPEDVSMYLTAVGVTGDDRDRLVTLARSASEPNWLTLGEPGAGEALSALIEFESTAQQITDWSPLLIPGLLQTGDYTRAIMTAAGGVPAKESDQRARVRLSRRDVLTRRGAVAFSAIVNEQALQQVIGSRDIMVDQLRHLRDSADLPTVTLQVLRLCEGWHPGLLGQFELLQFVTGRPIVHLEHMRASLFLCEEPDDLDDYVDAAATLRNLALSPEKSIDLITEMITQLEKEPT